MDTNLTIGALLAQGSERLRASSDSPALDAELLLTHALSVHRTRLKSHPEELVPAAQEAAYDALLQRRVTGEPLAYIVGHKGFWSLDLAVTPDVLVPRPETELLIERALALRDEPQGSVVDLGTGSGAIALSLASERPQWLVTAVDVSPAALAIARRNAAAHGLERVEFLAGSWFAPLKERRFDLIVSNPPYIAADDPALLHPALRHEPQLALTPGGDGMSSLRQIIRAAPAHLHAGGWLVLEHGWEQAKNVARELVACGFTHVRSHRDLARHERITEAWWK